MNDCSTRLTLPLTPECFRQKREVCTYSPPPPKRVVGGSFHSLTESVSQSVRRSRAAPASYPTFHSPQIRHRHMIQNGPTLVGVRISVESESTTNLRLCQTRARMESTVCAGGVCGAGGAGEGYSPWASPWYSRNRTPPPPPHVQSFSRRLGNGRGWGHAHAPSLIRAFSPRRCLIPTAFGAEAPISRPPAIDYRFNCVTRAEFRRRARHY